MRKLASLLVFIVILLGIIGCGAIGGGSGTDQSGIIIIDEFSSFSTYLLCNFSLHIEFYDYTHYGDSTYNDYYYYYIVIRKSSSELIVKKSSPKHLLANPDSLYELDLDITCDDYIQSDEHYEILVFASTTESDAFNGKASHYEDYYYGYIDIDGSGNPDEDCYGVNYNIPISGIAEPPAYYYLGLANSNGLVKHGEFKYLSGDYNNQQLSLPIKTWDNIPEGDYKLMLYATKEIENIGYLDKTVVGKLIQPVSVNDELFAKAIPCCTQGKNYVQAQKKLGELLGVESNIETRYGKLCKEGVGPEDAYSVAYCGISDTTGDYSGQIGYGYERRYSLWGNYSTTKYWYWEIRSSLPVNYHYEDSCCPQPPVEGQTHKYRCEVNPSTGYWCFYIDNMTQPLTQPYNYDWDNPTFYQDLWATWACETGNLEDDMPGTYSDSCSFTECKTIIYNGVWQNSNLHVLNLYSSDPNQWEIRWLSVNRFNIWDAKPLP